MSEMTSQIVAVTVFTERARVTRRGKIALDAGSHRLELTELPAILDPASLRVAARGTVATKLLGVDARMTFFKEAPAARVRDLEVRLQALEDEDAADTDRGRALEKHLAHLDGLTDATRIYAYGLANGKTTIAQQTELLSFLDEQRARLQERFRTVAARRRERGKEIEALRKEIGQLCAAKPRQRYTVAVDLDTRAAGEVEVDITYLLPQASWRPLYDVRLRGDELEVSYLAEVQQNTGEDWSSVALTLSTARTAQAVAIPRLKPWHLRSRMEAAPEAAFATGRGAAAGRWKSPDAGALESMIETPTAAPAMAAAEVETAKVEQSGGSVTFQIPSSMDVPGDNSPHKATVGIFRLRPLFDYVCVPKLSESVFRRAKVTNSSSYTLLPGRAQL